MAEDIPFISELDLEALLGVQIASGDLILAIALDSACDRVRSYMQQRINFVSGEVIKLNGTGRGRIRLPERPVRAVTAVTEDSVAIAPTTGYLIDKSFLVRVGQDWAWGKQNITVTYDHGYNVTAPLDLVVPADIRLVALSMARRIYKAVANAPAPPAALQGETMGSYSYTASSLPPEVSAAIVAASELLEPEKAVLDPYVIRKVAGQGTESYIT